MSALAPTSRNRVVCTIPESSSDEVRYAHLFAPGTWSVCAVRNALLHMIDPENTREPLDAREPPTMSEVFEGSVESLKLLGLSIKQGISPASPYVDPEAFDVTEHVRNIAIQLLAIDPANFDTARLPRLSLPEGISDSFAIGVYMVVFALLCVVVLMEIDRREYRSLRSELEVILRVMQGEQDQSEERIANLQLQLTMSNQQNAELRAQLGAVPIGIPLETGLYPRAM